MMEISSSYMSSGTEDTSRLTTESINYDQDLFLKVLSEQMQNQDPFNPLSETEWIAQMAEFESLNRMKAVDDKLQSLLFMQEYTQGTMLIGREIAYQDSQTGQTLKGVVTQLSVQDNQVVLSVNDKPIALKDVKQIYAGKDAS